MKPVLFLVAVLCSMGGICQTPTSPITLRPDSINGKDAHVRSLPNDRDLNWQKGPILALRGKEFFSKTFVGRAFLDFGIDSQTIDSVDVDSSFLFIYIDSTYKATSNGNKEMVVQLIDEKWSDSTVTWNNQPTASSTFQAKFKQDNSHSFYKVDVSHLVREHLASNAYYGLRLAYVDESPSAEGELFFGSSNHVNSTLHPKVVIYHSKVSVGIKESQNTTDLKVHHAPHFWNLQSTKTIVGYELYMLTGQLVDIRSFSGSINQFTISKDGNFTKLAYVVRVNYTDGTTKSKMLLK